MIERLAGICATGLILLGCGSETPPLSGDQGVPTNPCQVDNGGCSRSPLVACGVSADNEVICGACPAGYTGDGVTCERVACSVDLDCDDGIPCTADRCASGSVCSHTPDNALCPDGSTCSPTRGCVAGSICGSEADCDDEDPCTVSERCDTSTATCTFDYLDSDADGEIPLVCGGSDCDDARSDINLDGTEVCDGLDNDCDGVTDQDATLESDPRLRYDELNCGACGQACDDGETCYQGACLPCGGGGQPCCDSRCTSADSCGSGTCQTNGSCVVDGGTAICGGAACGGLGQPCCASYSCVGGTLCIEDTCESVPTACGDAANPTIYRLTELNIPTLDDVDAGRALGHNVDGEGTVCGITDYVGGVDNGLIDFAAVLPALSADVNLQAEIDAALACNGGTDCADLALDFEISTGTGCVSILILDGANQGAVLAGPMLGTLDETGDFYALTPSFVLTIPYVTDAGDITQVPLWLSDVILTGTLAGATLTNVVIGGYMEGEALESTFRLLLPILSPSGSITYEQLEGVFAGLNDVFIDGTCSALSVGFTASGAIP